jgi:hypothetical protein
MFAKNTPVLRKWKEPITAKNPIDLMPDKNIVGDIPYRYPEHYHDSISCDNCGGNELITGANICCGGFLCRECFDKLKKNR